MNLKVLLRSQSNFISAAGPRTKGQIDQQCRWRRKLAHVICRVNQLIQYGELGQRRLLQCLCAPANVSQCAGIKPVLLK